jgi:hypothetical protein
LTNQNWHARKQTRKERRQVFKSIRAVPSAGKRKGTTMADEIRKPIRFENQPTDPIPDEPDDELEIGTAELAASASRVQVEKVGPRASREDLTPDEHTRTQPVATHITDEADDSRVPTTTPTRPPSAVSRAGAAAAPAAIPQAAPAQEGPLFTAEEAKDFRDRWDAVQVTFVDEPRRSVERADQLVASAMKRLAEFFAEERRKLEHQWDRGGDVSTEDLRQALRHYRSFFARLLSV